MNFNQTLHCFFIFMLIPSGALADIESRSIDTDTLRSTISANRALISRFNSEYSKTLQSSADDEKARMKLSNIKNKIAVLERENKRFLSLLPSSRIGEGSPSQGGNVNGDQWKQMLKADKELFLFSRMGSLVKHEILTMKPSSFYFKILDKVISENRELAKKDFNELLLLCVYEIEPEARVAISNYNSPDPMDLKKIRVYTKNS